MACFEPAVIQLSTTFADRMRSYIDFLKKIHVIIIRVHEASQRIRLSPAFALDPDRRGLRAGDRLTHFYTPATHYARRIGLPTIAAEGFSHFDWPPPGYFRCYSFGPRAVVVLPLCCFV